MPAAIASSIRANKPPQVSKAGKRLLALYAKLDAQDQKTLLDLAEFLAGRESQAPEDIPPPIAIPRPERESVVKALKRLSSSYPMIDTAVLLNETSALMAQHVMQGRTAPDVIDELEALFENRYRQLIKQDGRK